MIGLMKRRKLDLEEIHRSFADEDAGGQRHDLV